MHVFASMLFYGRRRELVTCLECVCVCMRVCVLCEGVCVCVCVYECVSVCVTEYDQVQQ